jgi:hypothetical protein
MVTKPVNKIQGQASGVTVMTLIVLIYWFAVVVRVPVGKKHQSCYERLVDLFVENISEMKSTNKDLTSLMSFLMTLSPFLISSKVRRWW